MKAITVVEAQPQASRTLSLQPVVRHQDYTDRAQSLSGFSGIHWADIQHADGRLLVRDDQTHAETDREGCHSTANRDDDFSDDPAMEPLEIS